MRPDIAAKAAGSHKVYLVVGMSPKNEIKLTNRRKGKPYWVLHASDLSCLRRCQQPRGQQFDKIGTVWFDTGRVEGLSTADRRSPAPRHRI